MYVGGCKDAPLVKHTWASAQIPIWMPVSNKNTFIQALYDDAKRCLWAELTPEFVKSIPNVLRVKILSKDRNDYILHPPTGEQLNPESVAAIEKLRDSWGAKAPRGQIVNPDGLNAKAIMDEDHLNPCLREMPRLLAEGDVPMSDTNILVTGGRVPAGYRIGEFLFAKADIFLKKTVRP